MARHFAKSLEKESTARTAQIRQGYLLVTGRLPGKEEERLLVEYTEKHGMPNLCRALFNLSEFTYID